MRNAVFLMLHNDTHVQMILRSDGKFGLLGGKVEEGENFLKALQREVYEESGKLAKADCLIDTVQHEGIKIKSDMKSHVFSLKCTDVYMEHFSRSIAENRGTHSGEVHGVCLFEIDKVNWRGMNLAPTLLEELVQVFGKERILRD